MTSRDGWKACERRIAAMIGGQRVPVTGRSRGDQPDIAHDWLAVEVKARRRAVPALLSLALAQAKAAKRGNQLPIAIIHEVGRPYGEAVVSCRLADFLDWFGDGYEPSGVTEADPSVFVASDDFVGDVR